MQLIISNQKETFGDFVEAKWQLKDPGYNLKAIEKALEKEGYWLVGFYDERGNDATQQDTKGSLLLDPICYAKCACGFDNKLFHFKWTALKCQGCGDYYPKIKFILTKKQINQ